ncbi:MAG: tetratricopeptide repeat protein, partial [Planctomycetota bacterium]
PKNVVVMQNAASQYSMLGRVEEAITLGEQAHEADPLYLPGFSNLARFYLIAGRLDEAEAIYREVLALYPDDGDAYRRLGELHLLRGDSEEARSHFARFDEFAGYGDFSRLWFKAMVEHTAGNAIASTAATEEFERKFGEDNRSLCAEIRAWRDETDMAFGWLDKSLAARDPSLSVLKTDLFLTPLHADPSWNTLLEKIGLPTD